LNNAVSKKRTVQHGEECRAEIVVFLVERNVGAGNATRANAMCISPAAVLSRNYCKRKPPGGGAIAPIAMMIGRVPKHDLQRCFFGTISHHRLAL
jgi:hypothetical protein